MAAFEAAAEAGADGVELDVRTCKSGELVVCHDRDLSRVTDGRDPRQVADLPFSELRRTDVGGGERVPLLSEVLGFARSRGLVVNVEMKRDVPSRLDVVRKTADLLRTWDPLHPALVSSFDPWMLSALGILSPRVPRALLAHESWYDAISTRAAPPFRAHAIHVERTLTHPDRITRWKTRLVVNVWTVNRADEAKDLARLGVDGIITDCPAQIREAIDPR
jgi:glycerophosphoryl diester phosphodiesterase